MKSYSKLLFYTVLVSILSFFYSCSNSNLSTYKKFIEIPEYLDIYGIDSLPTKNDYPDVDAICLLDSYKREVVYDKGEIKPYTTYRTMIRVFKNFENFSKETITLFYNENLIELNARVIKPDGSAVVLKKSDIITTTSTIEGHEERKITLVYPNLENNSIIEMSYKTEKFIDVYGDALSLQYYYIPIVNSEYILKYPRLGDNDRPKNWYTQDDYINKFYAIDYVHDVNLNNIDGNKEPEITNDKGYCTKKWTFKNVPPLKPEPKMPPISYQKGRIEFSYNDNPRNDKASWTPIGSYIFSEFFESVKDSVDIVKKLADSITVNCKNMQEKMNELSKYVQLKIRYEAIEIGKSGYQPQAPQDVVKKGYGDCKGKSLLLIRLLQAVGFEAYPALLLTANVGYTNVNIPKFNFNHMIVFALDSLKNEVWIDATVPLCKLGDIPWQDEGVYGFVLYNKSKQLLKKIPLSNYQDNKILYSIKTKFVSDNQTQNSINIKCYGEMDLIYRNMLYDMDDEEIEKFAKGLLGSDYINTNIEDLSFSNLYELNNPLEINFKFKSDNSISKQGNLYFLNYDFLASDFDSDWLKSKERKYPITNKYLYTSKTEIEIEYPNDIFTITSIPDNFLSTNDNYEYQKLITNNNDSKILVNSDYVVKKAMIKSEKFSELKDFFTKVNNSNKSRIILNKKN